MTVLRSREIAPPKTTPQGPKTRPKSDPSTPAETPESVTTTTTTPPPLNSTPSSQSQSQNPNSNPNPKATDSGSATGLLRRRSLRLASKTPEGSAKRNTQIDEVGFDLFGERVTVMGVEKRAEELKLGSGLDPVTRLSGKGSGFGEEEKVGVDEGLTELGLSSDLGVLGGNSEEKKKRKLDIDINLPAWECEEEDGGSKPFLSLRSGKRVAKPGVDGVGNGEWVIDLSADKSGGVKSKGECGRGERGKGKLGENSIYVVVLDSDEEVERSGENVFQSDLPSGGSSTGKRKLSDAIEIVVEDSEDEMSSGENGVNEGRRKYSRQEKGKEKLVGGALLSNDDDKVELGLGLEVLSSLHNVVPSPTQIRENEALQDEMQARNSNRRENGRDRNQYMERFRDIARQNASRFARFDPREEEENDMPPQVDVEQDVEDWPGPFSTAMRIMRDGAEKNMQEQRAYTGKTKPALVNWVPKCQEQDRAISKNLIPSLQELCLSVLAMNADAIVSLESVPDALRHQLSHLLCDSRRMNTHFFELLVQGSPTEVRLRDCSWLTEEEFTKSFQQCDISNLTVLQLDQCGRCLPDYILNSTLARSSNCLPVLTSLSLSGACRLSDVGLGALVSSAPALRSLNLSQCSLLTSSSIDTLANSLGSVLRELYLNDCQSINAMLILPALEKFEHLEVLWLPGIENVCDDFIKKFITARGHNLKELILTNCINLTDSSVKVIAETCSGLCALDLVDLHKLTDSSLGYLANGCRAIQTLKFRQNSFSDEAIAAFLETSGECLKELSLNNIKKVGDNTAISLARHSRSLHSLDLSWCRNLTDEALGLIVDSCLSLKMLKLFGCTQITDLFLCGHSNPEVKIIGVKMTPILKDVKVPDPAAGPLHYSSISST
ncbi:putative leucine-rich repeat domain, L domain-containing protein [Rosa chinensis]|uniref:Putative leucine-rich repeat domain, L domain-containing protein n=1 Tax=Rosa chinensis TaxID=74649 RepID=A0A2P6RKM5_ROSCH|nr:uncharacterized protein LOC112190206 [Rosa chinensis]PRQ46982.1 putative leucine-rich repeat domain, L domain-containing protein [Rosa chinensis]